jgi:mRNA interferase MazF
MRQIRITDGAVYSLVGQSDEFNQSGIHTIVCVSITSNLALALAPGNLRLSARATGLPKPSVANVSQLITVDRRFFTERIRSLSKESMSQIEEGLRLVLKL